MSSGGLYSYRQHFISEYTMFPLFNFLEICIIALVFFAFLNIIFFTESHVENISDIRKTWRLIHAEKYGKNSTFAILTVETPGGIRRFKGRCYYRDADTLREPSRMQMKVLEEFWQKANSENLFH